jgi:TrmH family RNA methyltransferase
MPNLPQNPTLPRVVADYRRALSPGGQRQLGLFAIEGFRLVERALANDIPVAHVMVGQSDCANPAPRLAALLKRLEERNIALTVAPDPLIAELTEGRTLGGVLALAALPAPPPLEHLLERWAPDGTKRKLLVLSELMDPGNVGALMRTAHALGVEAVVALGGTDPFHPRSARTSMGSVFHIPVLRWDSAETLLALFRKHGVRTIGAATESSVRLPDARFTHHAMALFVGNEGKGLPPQLRDSLDQLVAIPMNRSIDSFSVNAATAVILYAMTYGTSDPDAQTAS